MKALTMETSQLRQAYSSHHPNATQRKLLNLPRGRIHIHHLTEEQRNLLKTVAAMQGMSMSEFSAESILAVIRKLRMTGPKEVQQFLQTKIPDEEIDRLRMQIH